MSMNGLSIADLAEIVGGHLHFGSMPPLGGSWEPSGHVAVDIRDVQPGDIFWALETSDEDAGERVPEAFIRDASGVVTSDRRIEPWAGKFSIQVEDTRWALWQLARWLRQRFPGRVVAVSGSMGKTTTRHLIDCVLRDRLSGICPQQHPHHRLGLPLNMLQLDEDLDYGLFEFSSSTPGEIQAISHLCCPEIAVINCILDGRTGDIEDEQQICETELLASLPRGGWGVLNGDHPRLAELAERTEAQVLLVGRGSHCDIAPGHVRYTSGSLSFVVEGTPFCVPVSGRHHLHAVLAAYAVGRIMQMEPDRIASALEYFRMPPQRCELLNIGDVTLINDTYDCRAATLRPALELLREVERPGRRIVVCGDVAEAEQERRLYHDIGRAVVVHGGADLLVACGRHRQRLIEAAREAGMPPQRTIGCSRAEQAGALLQSLVVAGDVVLVKGVDGAVMQRVVDTMRDEPVAVPA
jgi:UDP-N-acetylmuramoyl-tripeptide--D-alanyl-D-alanine ligase